MIRTRRALRGLHVLLVGVLSLTLSMGVAPARAYEPLPTSPFTDVATTSPYYEAISWMYETGISTGWSGMWSGRPSTRTVTCRTVAPA